MAGATKIGSGAYSVRNVAAFGPRISTAADGEIFFRDPFDTRLESLSYGSAVLARFVTVWSM